MPVKYANVFLFVNDSEQRQICLFGQLALDIEVRPNPNEFSPVETLSTYISTSGISTNPGIL